jgi:hypothetical protein
MTKKFLTLRFNTRGLPGTELARKYGCETCSVALLSPDGEVVARYLDHPSGSQVAEGIVGIPEVTAWEEQLAQLKAKGITKTNAESVAAALKKVGTLTSPKAQETILGYLKDEAHPEAVHRGAIMALSKQPAAAKELVPYLTDKRTSIKSAAQTTLIAMGPAGLPGLLDGLESEKVDERVAAYGPAAAVTKSGKVSRDLTFWKTGKAEDRAKALTEWKEWAANQNKPKPKDAPKEKDTPAKKKK